MKLTKKVKRYIYDRVKWYGYNLGSTKDFVVKLYFFRRDDYLDDEEGNVYEYFYSMERLFNILSKKGITYKEYFDENEYLTIEFSSKEIYKYIKYDINRGKKKKKLTPLERRLERESHKRLEEFFKIDSSEELEDMQPFIPGRAIYLPEDNPIKNSDINPTPHDEKDMYKRVKSNPIAKRVYNYISEELKKINEEDKLPQEGESVENKIYMDENGTPKESEVKVKMTANEVMSGFLNELLHFKKNKDEKNIRVVNEEGDEIND